MIPQIYEGEFSVIQCKGALASLTVAMKSVTPAKRQKSMLLNLLLQIERLSTGKRSVELSVRKEGELPSYNGKPKKNFWAIKKIPIRGYYWESDRLPRTFFISHYIYKDFDDLHDSDIKKVCNNWDRIERGLDDH